MQVIIAGAGKVGYNIAKHLMHNNDVTVIDQNEYAIQNIQENLDVLGICGNIENPHTYLGINPQIDLFVAVTDSDEVNLLSSIIIDHIATVKRKIIRLKNSFFASDQVKQKLNIHEKIVPSFEAAQPFKHLIDFTHAHNAKAFEYTKALLVSIRLCDDFTPRMISTFVGELNGEIAIAGMERKKQFFVPKPVETLLPNDLIYCLAFPSALAELRQLVFHISEPPTPIKTCLIFGADALGVEIAKVLLKKGIDVQIMDKNIDLCRKANIELKNKATVLKTTYDADHIINKNKFDTDMFIAATKNDEYNITKWYATLKSAQSEIDILYVKGYDKVEELDALIALLIKLTDIPENKQCVFLNDIVFVPTGIQFVPLYESVWIVFLFSITMCTILGITVYMEKD